MFKLLAVSRGIVLLSGMMAIGSAHATVIAGSDFVKTGTTHYVIDLAASSATYQPSFIVIGSDGSQPTENFGPFSISGSFDVERYQSVASPSAAVTSDGITNQILFTNASVTMNGGTDGFDFPNFFGAMTSDTAFQSLAVPDLCSNIPDGVIASCSTLFNLTSSSWSGQLNNQSIRIDGFAPTDSINAGYNYHIEASAVPLPGGAWLFASAFGLFGGMVQRKRRSK
jgi:hypothetical protein